MCLLIFKLLRNNFRHFGQIYHTLNLTKSIIKKLQFEPTKIFYNFTIFWILCLQKPSSYVRKIFSKLSSYCAFNIQHELNPLVRFIYYILTVLASFYFLCQKFFYFVSKFPLDTINKQDDQKDTKNCNEAQPERFFQHSLAQGFVRNSKSESFAICS